MDDPNQELSRCETQIYDLPSCLIIDILLRLPTKSLLRSRCVCKSWLLLFSDPVFVKLQLAGSPPCILVRDTRTRKLRFASLVGETIAGGNFVVDHETELVANMNFIPNSEFFDLVNTCNGLLCLRSSRRNNESILSILDTVYICNPMLGEYFSIASAEERICSKFSLGFSSKSNQFKVLRIYKPSYNLPFYSNAEIYTIGNDTRKWKSIEMSPSEHNCLHGDNNYLNGSIHWFDFRKYQLKYFDFESEKFGWLPLPSQYNAEQFGCVELGVLDGCLWVWFYSNVYHFELEIWVMKEYGVTDSWTKRFCIQSFFQYGQPLYLLNNKIILMWVARTGSVVYYDGKYNRIYDTNIIRAGEPSRAISYRPSFVSLQDVAKGEFTVPSRTRYLSEEEKERKRTQMS